MCMRSGDRTPNDFQPALAKLLLQVRCGASKLACRTHIGIAVHCPMRRKPCPASDQGAAVTALRAPDRSVERTGSGMTG